MKEKISSLPLLRSKRRTLRTNSTPQEIIVWSRLKNKQLGFKFRRQHSFGNYITDFYCPDRELVVEIDGSQHLDQEKYDEERTRFFEDRGLKIARFWDSEVNANIEGVIARVIELLE